MGTEYKCEVCVAGGTYIADLTDPKSSGYCLLCPACAVEGGADPKGRTARDCGGWMLTLSRLPEIREKIGSRVVVHGVEATKPTFIPVRPLPDTATFARLEFDRRLWNEAARIAERPDRIRPTLDIMFEKTKLAERESCLAWACELVDVAGRR